MEIKRVSIIGANGTMGKNVAAIFASFGNAKVYMICRDLEKAKKAKFESSKSIRSESILDNLIPATYDDLFECVSKSDLVFESLSEDLKIKSDLYLKMEPYINDKTIIATGTSGISIKKLAESFGDKSNQFFGVHMFNPPYTLTFCELISHDETQKKQEEEIKKYLANKLNRTVVEVKDSPSFLGNRIGFFFINEAMKLAEENMDQGGIDYVDSILGCFTGRSMSPLTTADFVGLDVTKSIVDYIYTELRDDFQKSFEAPKFLTQLIEEKKLGRKVNYGLYHFDKDTKTSYVFDIKQNDYRLKNNYEFYFSNEMIKNIEVGDYNKAFSILLKDESKESCMCKKMILKYILYSLKISHEVSNDIESCDDAMGTGFSWIPPIALIHILGGIKVVQQLTDKYLDEKFKLIAYNREIVESIPSYSKYDFRPFLKAKY